VRTEDGQRVFVQLLQDNFSRKIIAWIVNTVVSGLSTSTLLRKGCEQLKRAPDEMISLIVDGGPENNNRNVEAVLEGLPVRKLIAGVEIRCSNSMIEAVNKIMKYQYLFRKPIPSPEHLKRWFPEMVEDFNGRPHYALSGLTPNEAYDGKVFDKEEYHRRIVEAGIARRAINGHSCPPCAEAPVEEVAGEVRGERR